MPGHKKGPVLAKDAPEPVKEEVTVPATSQVPEPPSSEEPPLPPPNEEVPPPLPPEEPQVTIKLITWCLLNYSAFFPDSFIYTFVKTDICFYVFFFFSVHVEFCYGIIR